MHLCQFPDEIISKLLPDPKTSILFASTCKRALLSNDQYSDILSRHFDVKLDDAKNIYEHIAIKDEVIRVLAMQAQIFLNYNAKFLM